jgi:hypothetical protein
MRKSVNVNYSTSRDYSLKKNKISVKEGIFVFRPAGMHNAATLMHSSYFAFTNILKASFFSSQKNIVPYLYKTVIL